MRPRSKSEQTTKYKDININLKNDMLILTEKEKYINTIFVNLFKLYFQHYYIDIRSIVNNQILKKSYSDSILNEINGQNIVFIIYCEDNDKKCYEYECKYNRTNVYFKCMYSINKLLKKVKNDITISYNPIHNEVILMIELNQQSFLYEYICKYLHILFNIKVIENINNKKIHKIICKFLFETTNGTTFINY